VSAGADDGLDKLVHDVRSKCDSLRSAAGLLRGSTPAERRELLALMARQAESLAKLFAERKP
jgi:hypothetical protein